MSFCPLIAVSKSNSALSNLETPNVVWQHYRLQSSQSFSLSSKGPGSSRIETVTFIVTACIWERGWVSFLDVVYSISTKNDKLCPPTKNFTTQFARSVLFCRETRKRTIHETTQARLGGHMTRAKRGKAADWFRLYAPVAYPPSLACAREFWPFFYTSPKLATSRNLSANKRTKKFNRMKKKNEMWI